MTIDEEKRQTQSAIDRLPGLSLPFFFFVFNRAGSYSVQLSAPPSSILTVSLMHTLGQ